MRMKRDSIQAVIDTLEFPEVFKSMIYYDKDIFGAIIIDLVFTQLCIRVIQSRDGIDAYICPKDMIEFTYTVREVLLVLKIKQHIFSASLEKYLVEMAALLTEHWESVQRLFVLKNDIPLIAKYVYQSNRKSVWEI